MLGLRRHAVRIRQSDPTWGAQFQEWRRRIGEATGIPNERIEHIGSTSVPDLPAKPILDIDLGMTDSDDIEYVVSCLIQLGFIDRGIGRGGPGRLLVCESAPEIRTIHLHIVEFRSESWRRDIAFRDALLEDPELRDRYRKVKSDLAKRFPADRRSYREGKNGFIGEALDQLLAED